MCTSVLAGVWTSVNQSLLVALRVCVNLGGMGSRCVSQRVCVCPSFCVCGLISERMTGVQCLCVHLCFHVCGRGALRRCR